MAKKGQKFNKYSDEKIKQILQYKENHSYSQTAEKFNVPWATIANWKHNNRLKIPRSKVGRKKSVEITIEEKYEILKKFIDFLENPKNKK